MIAAGLLELLLIIAAAASLIWLGRMQGEDKTLKRILDDIDKANKARDALEHDPAAAERVRERFTR